MNSGLTSSLASAPLKTPRTVGVGRGVALLLPQTGSGFFLENRSAADFNGVPNSRAATAARGANAVDLQLGRGPGTTAIASGSHSFIGGGSGNIASGQGSGTVAGFNNTVSGFGCFSAGSTNTASGTYCNALGFSNTVTQTANNLTAFALGALCVASAASTLAIGQSAVANRIGQFTQAHTPFAVAGDAQISRLTARIATSDATQTEMTLTGASPTGSAIPTATRIIIDPSSTWMVGVRIVARSTGGTDNAVYHRRCCIKRDAANNTVLVGAVQVVGTDIESNPAWDVSLASDDTNESLQILVTGAAATSIRWVAEIDLVQVSFS